jgi:hypothetical protein
MTHKNKFVNKTMYLIYVLDKCIRNVTTLLEDWTLYRVSQDECGRLREGVPCVKVCRCNPKHLCPKLNGYGDNGHRSLKL